MHVIKLYKLLVNLFLFFSLFISSYSISFNVCDVSLNEPWFEIKDALGEDILIIDNDGDMYARGENHNLNNGGFNSLVIDSMHFNSQTSKYSILNQDLSTLPTTPGLLINSASNIGVAHFSGDKISLKGKAAVDGENANCGINGNYCNNQFLESHRFYCDITGSKTGICSQSSTFIEDCSTKHNWVCLSGNDLRTEQSYECLDSGPSSSCSVSSTSTPISCASSNNGWSCNNNQEQYNNYICSSGSCVFSSASQVSDCGSLGCDGNRCKTCDSNSWNPDPSTICQGNYFEQTNDCGDVNSNILGTKTDDDCSLTPPTPETPPPTICTLNDHKSCNQGSLYWYDNCGNRGNKIKTCDGGCNNNVCKYSAIVKTNNEKLDCSYELSSSGIFQTYSMAQVLYENYGGRCGESSGLSYWDNHQMVNELKNYFVNTYKTTCSSLGLDSSFILNCNRDLLCEGSDTYITKSNKCRKLGGTTYDAKIIIPSSSSYNEKLDCADYSFANFLYITYGGRCGEPSGLYFWNSNSEVVSLINEFNKVYNEVCSSYDSSSRTNCNNKLLCDDGDVYISNTPYCRVVI